ncbi:neutral/alkaline non-lysosomal ceramidase N-terminal domain-containing protein [Persicitalea sp.]|uniref:neutral/alkaline non-lysosomal ceramidase N-terminal domain-containing protein n=1 Tax=Persicitalea sp. TaxID=3100273 RepID=UPI0035948608
MKTFLKILAGILVALLLFVASAVTTIDYTPYREMDYYRAWKDNIGAVRVVADTTGQPLRAGWAKANITPPQPGPMAGYGNRWGKPYESVHDSVYVRAIFLDNGLTQAAIVAADLLIVPPTVTEALKKRLPEVGLTFGQVYLGATHSHSSIGGWGDTITGELFAGDYDPAVVERIADAMIQAIQRAKSTRQTVEMGYMQVQDTTDIRNRLTGERATIDPWVRNLQLRGADGRTALLSSYAAHSTTLGSSTMSLSRDYAGALVDSLEDGEADFALFLAGAVGSMGPQGDTESEFTQLSSVSDGVETAIQSKLGVLNPQSVNILESFTVALPLREPTPRLNTTWALRPWVFRWAFGDYPSFVKALRVGNVLLVGLPCDFSGELMAELTKYANARGLHLMVTSFDGAYAGYITADRHFDKNLYETVTMNWFGPYNGAYFSEIVRDVIDKMDF